MAYEPIHHKYRPQTFRDLVGQETIALTLSNALNQEKIATAYLFTGPRGTGKTSSARILAKSLNCLTSNKPTPEPCGKCEACIAIAKGTALDVVEIDAASNTGVDNIREIIERSRFAPVQCRYKIYVIDECHMLSTAAFNALLKTLEEPPPQVVFILATTDPQRVLSTIISRCQRFDYRRIPLAEMVSHLRYIADTEAIAIADDALSLIAQIANGGLRDAESLLDQLSLLPDTISVEKVWDLVGAVPEQDLLKLLQAINSNNSLGVLQQCRSLLDRGREPIVVLQNLASFYLNLLIAKTAPQHSEMVAVTETCWQQLCNEAVNWDTDLILHSQQHLKEAETQLKHTTQPRLWLEVTLLGLLPQKAITEALSSPQPDQAVSDRRLSTADISTLNNIPATPTKQPLASNTNSETSKEIVQSSNSLARQTTEPKIDSQPSELLEQPQETVPQTSNVRKQIPEISSPVSTSVAASNEIEEPQPVTNNSFDIQEIWHQVVSCLQPPTTQALLKQQCHLIDFDGSSAIVGISSAKLQKLNQGKVPNIEKAFARVVQHQVKVQLEVASSNNNSPKKNTIPINNAASEISKPTANSEVSKIRETESYIEPKKPDFATQNKTYEPTKSDVVATPSPSVSDAQSVEENLVLLPIPVSSETASIPEQEIIEPNSDLNYDDDELQKAIASLTHSFEGELVEMDDSKNEILEVYEVTETEELTNTDNLDRPSIEDYDDDW